MRSIMVTGVSGVGKTTIARQIATSVDSLYGDYADIMLEVSNETDKDLLQKLPWVRRRLIYDQVEQIIDQRCAPSAEQTQPLFVLENHLTIIQDGEIVSFAVEEYVRYNMAGLVVIEADAKEVIDRRRTDLTRRRDIGDLELVRTQQASNWSQAQQISERLTIPCIRLLNPTNRQPMGQLLEWLAQIVEGQQDK